MEIQGAEAKKKYQLLTAKNVAVQTCKDRQPVQGCCYQPIDTGIAAKFLLPVMKVAKRKALDPTASGVTNGVRVGNAKRRKIHRLEAAHTGDDQVQTENQEYVEPHLKSPALDPAKLDLPGTPEEDKGVNDTWEAELTSKGAKQRAKLEKKAKEAVESAKKKGRQWSLVTLPSF